MRHRRKTTMLVLAWAILLAGPVASAPPEKAAPKINFLDSEQAGQLLVDEENEPYFSLMQPLEMSAKTGRAISGASLEEQRAECRRRYREAALDFSADEIAEVTWVISELQRYLQSRYAKIAKLDWNLLKLDSLIEGGMAHTRGSHIVLPSALLRAAVSSRDAGRAERLSVLGLWLLHEQLHVAQRAYPELFEQLYTKLWGFRRVDFPEPNPWMVKHQLINPDAVGDHWIYPIKSDESTVWIWPTVVLAESRGIRRLLGVPSLSGDLRMVAVEVRATEKGLLIVTDANGMPVIRRLLSLQEYRGAFPYAMAPFHPNEIAAEGFARLAIIDLTAPYPDGEARVRRWSDPRTSALSRWFSQNLD